MKEGGNRTNVQEEKEKIKLEFRHSKKSGWWIQKKLFEITKEMKVHPKHVNAKLKDAFK